jgi:hypothetical protein
MSTISPTTAANCVYSIQAIVNELPGNVNIGTVMTSLASSVADSKQIAVMGEATVPEGTIERVDSTMQNLTFFAQLTDNQFSILLAKLKQLGKNNEAEVLPGLILAVRMMIATGQSLIIPIIISTVPAVKPVDS